MTTTRIRTRATRAAVKAAIASIPQELTEGSSDTQEILTNCGLAILERIREAFLVKSAGGTDDAGDRWAPLKPSTIAYSRSGRTRTESKRSSQPSQALNSRQQTRWWSLYRQGLAIYKGDKAIAAKRAWAILKSEGATTIVQKYGTRRVDILYKTGGLFNSITSKVTASGEIIISSDHPAAAAHHHGARNKGIPQRRLWPDPRNWPSSWWQDILDVIREGAVDMIERSAR